MSHLEATLGEDMRREMENLLYHVSNTTHAWQGKVIFGSVLTVFAGIAESVTSGYTGVLGGKLILLTMLLYMLCADLVIGVFRAAVHHDLSGPVFWRGAAKYPLIAIYLALSGVCDIVIASFGVGGYVLDFMAAYLTMCQISSILINLEKLGVQVPAPLQMLVVGSIKTLDTLIRDSFKVGRRKTDRPGQRVVEESPELKVPQSKPYIPGERDE